MAMVLLILFQLSVVTIIAKLHFALKQTNLKEEKEKENRKGQKQKTERKREAASESIDHVQPILFAFAVVAVTEYFGLKSCF